jgi:uncharacterized protein YraI
MNTPRNRKLLFVLFALGATILLIFAFVPERAPDTAIDEPEKPAVTEPKPKRGEYIEVVDSCGPYFEGACVNVRSGPGTEYTSIEKLRTGVVLKVDGSTEAEEHTWYKVTFDEWLRYSERVQGDWYIASDYVKHFTDIGVQELGAATSTASDKRILIDRSEQTLYAYDGQKLFMEEKISTGLDLTPTPRGLFKVFRKTPTRYMQGPLPGISDQYYDLPGVPWNLYFTEQGGAIHGTYWHTNFGKQHSHGCVNLPIEAAKKLYDWADLGTHVTVRD